MIVDFSHATLEDPSGKKSKSKKGESSLPELKTLRYSSPEAVRAIKDQDEKADVDWMKNDVWAIGVNLYLAIAKRLPFDGETQDEYVDNLLDDNSSMAELPDSTP